MTSDPKEKLVGIWISDPADLDGQAEFGRATIEFTADGRLTHTIHEPGNDSKILLTYEVHEDTIITDQPSSPKNERTTFSLEHDGRLTLWFGNERSVYVRRGTRSDE